MVYILKVIIGVIYISSAHPNSWSGLNSLDRERSDYTEVPSEAGAGAGVPMDIMADHILSRRRRKKWDRSRRQA